MPPHLHTLHLHLLTPVHSTPPVPHLLRPCLHRPFPLPYCIAVQPAPVLPIAPHHPHPPCRPLLPTAPPHLHVGPRIPQQPPRHRPRHHRAKPWAIRPFFHPSRCQLIRAVLRALSLPAHPRTVPPPSIPPPAYLPPRIQHYSHTLPSDLPSVRPRHRLAATLSPARQHRSGRALHAPHRFLHRLHRVRMLLACSYRLIRHAPRTSDDLHQLTSPSALSRRQRNYRAAHHARRRRSYGRVSLRQSLCVPQPFQHMFTLPPHVRIGTHRWLATHPDIPVRGRRTPSLLWHLHMCQFPTTCACSPRPRSLTLCRPPPFHRLQPHPLSATHAVYILC
eukprot:4821447-Prymnesium_polylepis.1